MDFFVELVMALVLEGSIEAQKSKKIPKHLRYILLSLVILFFATIVALIAFVGIIMIRESNVLAGIFMFLFSMFIAFGSIVRCRKGISSKKQRENEQ